MSEEFMRDLEEKKDFFDRIKKPFKKVKREEVKALREKNDKLIDSLKNLSEIFAQEMKTFYKKREEFLTSLEKFIYLENDKEKFLEKINKIKISGQNIEPKDEGLLLIALENSMRLKFLLEIVSVSTFYNVGFIYRFKTRKKYENLREMVEIIDEAVKKNTLQYLEINSILKNLNEIFAKFEEKNLEKFIEENFVELEEKYKILDLIDIEKHIKIEIKNINPTKLITNKNKIEDVYHEDRYIKLFVKECYPKLINCINKKLKVI